jgi:obg-like ATPase 1
MSYTDLKEHGSEAAVKAVSITRCKVLNWANMHQAGKVRQQGKPYVMIDGDIAYWKAGQ